MGHQVNFYLTQSDLHKVESIICDVSPFAIMNSRSLDSKPRVLDGWDCKEGSDTWLYFFLVQRDKIDEVIMNSVPEQGYWAVDVNKSPVVQFNKCFFNGHILRRGRAYYVDKYYDSDGKPVTKSDSFRGWAKAIFAAIKKSLKKHGSDYIGAEAEAWRLSGAGELVV